MGEFMSCMGSETNLMVLNENSHSADAIESVLGVHEILTINFGSLICCGSFVYQNWVQNICSVAFQILGNGLANWQLVV